MGGLAFTPVHETCWNLTSSQLLNTQTGSARFLLLNQWEAGSDIRSISSTIVESFELLSIHGIDGDVEMECLAHAVLV